MEIVSAHYKYYVTSSVARRYHYGTQRPKRLLCATMASAQSITSAYVGLIILYVDTDDNCIPKILVNCFTA